MKKLSLMKILKESIDGPPHRPGDSWSYPRKREEQKLAELEDTKELYFRVGGFHSENGKKLLPLIRKYEPDFEMDKESDGGGWDL